VFFLPVGVRRNTDKKEQMKQTRYLKAKNNPGP
jgi:hypothetical protein